MIGFSAKYWRQWRLGVLLWLIGVAGAFFYLEAWPEKQGVNSFLMLCAAAVGVFALVDPFLHPWLIKRGYRRP